MATSVVLCTRVRLLVLCTRVTLLLTTMSAIDLPIVNLDAYLLGDGTSVDANQECKKVCHYCKSGGFKSRIN